MPSFATCTSRTVGYVGTTFRPVVGAGRNLIMLLRWAARPPASLMRCLRKKSTGRPRDERLGPRMAQEGRRARDRESRRLLRGRGLRPRRPLRLRPARPGPGHHHPGSARAHPRAGGPHPGAPPLRHRRAAGPDRRAGGGRVTHYRLSLTKGRKPVRIVAERHSYSHTPPSGWWRSVQLVGSSVHVRVCWVPDAACEALRAPGGAPPAPSPAPPPTPPPPLPKAAGREHEALSRAGEVEGLEGVLVPHGGRRPPPPTSLPPRPRPCRAALVRVLSLSHTISAELPPGRVAAVVGATGGAVA